MAVTIRLGFEGFGANDVPEIVLPSSRETVFEVPTSLGVVYVDGLGEVVLPTNLPIAIWSTTPGNLGEVFVNTNWIKLQYSFSIRIDFKPKDFAGRCIIVRNDYNEG